MVTSDVAAKTDQVRAAFWSAGEDVFTETLAVYQRILELARTSGCAYLVKCHNFVPDINRDRRYEAFNAGRRKALEEGGYLRRPASCALGSIGTRGLEISCLLGSAPPFELENPRQVSAYEYPPQFGPRPLFARAVLDRGRLYVSGTASIVGFKSVHPGDLVLQYEETLRNIEQITGPLNVPFSDLSFIVYVKKPEYVSVIRDLFAQSAEYIVSDICRPELLIEIEATSKHGKYIAPVHTRGVHRVEALAGAPRALHLVQG